MALNPTLERETTWCPQHDSKWESNFFFITYTVIQKHLTLNLLIKSGSFSFQANLLGTDSTVLATQVPELERLQSAVERKREENKTKYNMI